MKRVVCCEASSSLIGKQRVAAFIHSFISYLEKVCIEELVTRDSCPGYCLSKPSRSGKR
jgi:hypothetical protein